MKYLHALPPLVAVVISWAWINSEDLKIQKIESEILSLQKKLSFNRSPEVNSPLPKFASVTKTNPSPGTSGVDWEKVKQHLSVMGSTSSRENHQLCGMLRELTLDQLLIAYDEMKNLGLRTSMKKRLQSSFLECIAEKSPKDAVTRLGLPKEYYGLFLGSYTESSMKRWAKVDYEAASSWLKKHISSDPLKGLNLNGEFTDIIQHHNAALFQALLHIDYLRASEKLANLSENERLILLKRSNFQLILSEKEEANYAQLLRNHTDSATSLELLKERAEINLANSTQYEDLDRFISTIKTTDSEYLSITR